MDLSTLQISEDNSRSTLISRLMEYKWIIVATVVFALLLLGLYLYKTKKIAEISSTDEYIPGTTSGQDKKEAELMFFYVNWCPHCKTAKPEWDKIKGEYDETEINGYTLIFTDINCTEENSETDKLLNTYNIEGYPTIKMIKDGQIIEYDAKPSYDTLVQFINSVV